MWFSKVITRICCCILLQDHDATAILKFMARIVVFFSMQIEDPLTL